MSKADDNPPIRDRDLPEFRDPPSRLAPAHDKPVPIVEPEEMQKLQAIVRHWQRVMHSPGSEPEYVEAMARLRELQAAAMPPAPLHIEPDILAYRRIIVGQEAQIADLQDKINGLEGWITTLTAQRDAAVAVCLRLDRYQKFYGQNAYDIDGMPGNQKYSEWAMSIVKEARAAIALCAPAPVVTEAPGEGGDTIDTIKF